MQIETLREYLVFAKYLNFSTAAKKLFISQPALSNHIANLEKELGVELIRRDQKLELTAAGKAFFEGSFDVVASYDAVHQRVKELALSEKQGSLTVKMAFGEGGGSVRLAELIGIFKRMNPAVSVKFVSQGKNSVIDDLVAGVFDCAQLFNYSPKSDNPDLAFLDYQVIDRAPVTLAANKEHPLMTKEQLSFADIQEYPYAMPAGASFTECFISVEQLYEEHGIDLKNVHYKVVDTLTDLIASGMNGNEFLILGPSPTLPKSMTYRTFEPEVYQDFCLVYRKDNPNPVLHTLVSFVRQHQDEPA